MTTSRPVAVTGSTGHLGGLIARRLAEAGIHQRLLARNPDKAPSLPHAHAVQNNYIDQASTLAALDGVNLVFMTSAHEGPDRMDQHRAFIDAAARAGVDHLVYTSFHGASPDSTFTLAREHWETEQYIKSRGLRYTFLRDTFYLDFLPHLAGDDGVIRGPAGDGRLAGVAVADIAEAAANVLLDPKAHLDRTYELSGGEPLTMTEIAQIITEVTGTATSFHNETIDEAYAARVATYGAPDWQNDAWVTTYTAIAHGDFASVSDDIQTLTGRPPATLRETLERD